MRALAIYAACKEERWRSFASPAIREEVQWAAAPALGWPPLQQRPHRQALPPRPLPADRHSTQLAPHMVFH